MTEFLQIFLTVDILLMAALALFYLRRRKLSLLQTIIWSLLALLLPVIGPFIVIVARPGKAAGSSSHLSV